MRTLIATIRLNHGSTCGIDFHTWSQTVLISAKSAHLYVHTVPLRVRNRQKNHPGCVSRSFPMCYDWSQVAGIGPHTATKQDFFKFCLLCEAKIADNFQEMCRRGHKWINHAADNSKVVFYAQKEGRERCIQSFKIYLRIFDTVTV